MTKIIRDGHGRNSCEISATTQSKYFFCVFSIFLEKTNWRFVIHCSQVAMIEIFWWRRKLHVILRLKQLKWFIKKMPRSEGGKQLKFWKRKFYVKRSPTETKYACIVTVCFLFWPNAIFLDQRCFHEHVLLQWGWILNSVDDIGRYFFSFVYQVVRESISRECDWALTGSHCSVTIKPVNLSSLL